MSNTPDVTLETRVIEIDPRKLKLLPRNARFMRHETFARLRDNIAEDGVLTQIPFCAPLGYYTAVDELPRDDDEIVYEVLSGNHRVKAAIAAGLKTIQVQVTDQPLSRGRRLAIQLSHNAVTGEDDPEILAALYEEIDNLGDRAYSGLDDKTLALLAEPEIPPLNDPALDFQLISMTFLPSEVEAVEAVWDTLKAAVTTDQVWLARWEEYDRFLDKLELVKASYGIRNVATGLMVMVELVSRHLDELREGWLSEDGQPLHTNWIPIETILLINSLPVRTAQLVQTAVDRMMSTGQIEGNERWKALHLMAERFLAEE